MILSKNIFVSYDKKEDVIANGSFHIRSGEFVFISGRSGSGKSTLLKAMYGEVGVDKGALLVAQTDLKNISSSKLRALRKKIGIIFQDYKLINEYTIEENIMLPLKINGHTDELSRNQANKLLKHVKMSHQSGKYPAQLSGGEQQRVAVARALAHNPKIIFADEPTGNLDSYSASVVMDLLRKANEQLGITVVIVTHNIPKNFGIHYRQLSISDGVIYEVS